MTTAELALKVEALGRRSRIAGALSLAGAALMIGAVGVSALGVYRLQAETRRLEAQRTQLKADILKLTRAKSDLLNDLITSQDSLAKADSALQTGDVTRAQKAIDSGQAAVPAGAAPVARVFFQLRNSGQIPIYKTCSAALVATGYRVPAYDMLPNTGPAQSEIRYYHKVEGERVKALAADLAACGAGPMRIQYIRRFETSSKVKPLVFEVWLAPAKGQGAE